MKRALILGNCEYEDSKLSRLKAPSRDAADLAGLLRDPEIGAFDEVQVLENEHHDIVNMAIARFFKDRRPDDLLFFYFSGHGVKDENGCLFLAVKSTTQEFLRQTGISSNSIQVEMDQCACKTQILVLDCCHSGAFLEGSKSSLNQSVGTKSAFEGNGRGRVILTASDSLQYAWEGDKVIGETQNSLFTHFFLEGLRTGAADANQDGIITLEELYQYTYSRILEATPRQTPQKWNLRQQGEIKLAKAPAFADKPRLPDPGSFPPAPSPVPEIGKDGFKELERLAADAQGKAQALIAFQKLKELTDHDSRMVSRLARASIRRLRAIKPEIPWVQKEPDVSVLPVKPEIKPVKKENTILPNIAAGSVVFVTLAVMLFSFKYADTIIQGSVHKLNTLWLQIHNLLTPSDKVQHDVGVVPASARPKGITPKEVIGSPRLPPSILINPAGGLKPADGTVQSSAKGSVSKGSVSYPLPMQGRKFGAKKEPPEPPAP